MEIQDADKKAIELWRRGDPKGFSELYNRYKSRVLGFIVRMTQDKDVAEDLLHETFLAALKNRHQYDSERNFLSWIFGIAHKKTIDHFRHRKVEDHYSQEGDRAVGSKFDDQQTRMRNRLMQKMVKEAVDTLEPAQREVFLMRELGDVPFREIALIMDCPINTALGRMRLALKNIRKELQRRGVYGL